MRTRIKFCGITRLVDAKLAVQAGCDAVGLIFYSASKRAIDLATARQISFALSPFVTKVGVFVNSPPSIVKTTLHEVAIDLLQFHGEETVEYCESFKRPYIKAIRVKNTQTILAAMQTYTSASAILLDTYHQECYGGVGSAFDWSVIPSQCDKPIILAGGINLSNLQVAIQKYCPYAIDICSGVEQSPGIKEYDKMQQICRAVRLADER